MNPTYFDSQLMNPTYFDCHGSQNRQGVLRYVYCRDNGGIEAVPPYLLLRYAWVSGIHSGR